LRENFLSLMPSPRQAFVGVGANLGDRPAAIRAALAALRRAPGILALESSAIYETAPVGYLDQPPFLNLVLGLVTTLTPEELLELLRATERAAGRTRAAEIRWGPRTLDLDLLLFESETRATPDLTLPHPRMWDRPFVTIPFAELFSRVEKFRTPAWQSVLSRLPAHRFAPGVSIWTPPA
jgi:2-amino-4-hydroxy-6-hydroxymethyldihydropteridine diphosphokinase